MTNPADQPGGTYHPGQNWPNTAGVNAPYPNSPAGGQIPTAGYGYPGPPPQPQHTGYSAQPYGYQPNVGAQYAGYGPQNFPATPHRPSALTAGAALSFLTGATLGVAGGLLLTLAAAAGSARSSLSSTFGSTLDTYSGIATRGLATLAIIAVILLVIAFTLLYGAIDATLARSTAVAITGNVIAAVLTFIVVILTTAWLLVWLVIPVIAVIALVQGSVRSYIAGRAPVD